MMAINAKDLIARLPEDRQLAIKARAKEIIQEEMDLQNLRKARKLSQENVAKRLGVKQAAISKIEKKADIYIGTLKKYVEAIGGRVEILASFSDRPPVKILGFRGMKVVVPKTKKVNS